MAITVRFFASLREQLGIGERILEDCAPATVREVWEAATGDREPPARVLAAVNMHYAELETPVSDGDEVAFFPPVTGGSDHDRAAGR